MILIKKHIFKAVGMRAFPANLFWRRKWLSMTSLWRHLWPTYHRPWNNFSPPGRGLIYASWFFDIFDLRSTIAHDFVMLPQGENCEIGGSCSKKILQISASFYYVWVTIPPYIPSCDTFIFCFVVLFQDGVNSGHVRAIYVLANDLSINKAQASTM